MKKPKKPLLTPKQYANNKKGIRCPFCKSTELLGGPLIAEDNHVHSHVACRGCGRSYDDEYTLTGYLLHEEEE